MRKSIFAPILLLLWLAGPVAASTATEPVPDLNPEPPVARLAYVTETAASPARVWLASATGAAPKPLGPGDQPLLAPNGQSVAVSLFGSKVGAQESGESIAIYSATGAPTTSYLNLATATTTSLAWSPDSRYLAVYVQSNALTNIAASSGLDVIDTQTGAVTSIAKGLIYGASFARDGSDRVVLALAHSLLGKASTNLYISNPDGSDRHRLTDDGGSLNPVWGPKYIAYDRERRRSQAPIYQIWLATSSNARVRRLTNVPADPLVEGLVPLAFSADGGGLLAEFVGEDTSAAWTVDVASGRARELRLAHHRLGELMGAGISQNGSTVLIDQNVLENPPSSARIVAMPFSGGAPRVLVAHGAEASWNR